MAVSFNDDFRLLVQHFRSKGLHPEIKTVGGEPPRAVEIRLSENLSVHWDADSRTVWAEGPWPDSEKLEAYLRRRFGGRSRRARNRARLFRTAALAVVLLLIAAVAVPILQRQSLTGSSSEISATSPAMVPAPTR